MIKFQFELLDRRLDQMRAEGVDFQTGVNVGEDISLKYLQKQFNAICLNMGAGESRDLVVPGRGLENIHFAMEYLAQQNRINAGLATEHLLCRWCGVRLPLLLLLHAQ